MPVYGDIKHLREMTDAELIRMQADGVRDRGWGDAAQIIEEDRLRAIADRLEKEDN